MANTPPKITISQASSVDASTSVTFKDLENKSPSHHVLNAPVSTMLPAQLRRLQKGVDYKNLNNLLRKQAIPHEDSHTSNFWPATLLDNLVTRERIQEELEAIRNKRRVLQTEFNDNLADEIHLEFRKIFAILCLLDMGEHITGFIEEGVKDSDLPLVACIGKEATEDYELARKAAPNESLRCIREFYRVHDRESFAHIQHRFNPAYFSLGIDPESGKRDIRHEQFDPDMILPIEKRKPANEGGYGMVSRVRINPSCHEFSNVLGAITTDDEFALKELIKQPDAAQSKSDREFWKEVDNLKRFSGFFHPHLVTLLMTWTIKNSYFLLFPLAKYDLNQYLDLKRIPPDPLTNLPDLSMLQWISKQIFGMIGALKTIHNPGAGPSDYLSVEEQKFGRHGDLKPENILWYESSADTKGILVIADLGLAALNTILSRSNISNGKVPGTPQYRPPEHDIVGGQVSRSYDIWTLGCLLLEFVCWALKGPEGRAEFATQRKTIYVNGCISDIFFSVERDNDRDYVMRIKQEVSEEIEALHHHPHCSEFFHDLLDLIEGKMLVVISRNQNRISAIDLVTEITRIDAKVTNDGSRYCQKPHPKFQRSKLCDPVKVTLKREILNIARLDIVAAHLGKSQPAATAEQLAG